MGYQQDRLATKLVNQREQQLEQHLVEASGYLRDTLATRLVCPKELWMDLPKETEWASQMCTLVITLVQLLVVVMDFQVCKLATLLARQKEQPLVRH